MKETDKLTLSIIESDERLLWSEAKNELLKTLLRCFLPIHKIDELLNDSSAILPYYDKAVSRFEEGELFGENPPTEMMRTITQQMRKVS